ncbi:hypothetical protein F7E97_29925, partial [Escherichia coli]
GEKIAHLKENQESIVFQIFKDTYGRIWLCTERGLKLLNPEKLQENKIELLPLSKSFQFPALQKVIMDMLQDHSGNLWFATSEGLVKISPSGYAKTFTGTDGLPSSSILSILMDRETNLWIGTMKGVAKIPLSGSVEIFNSASFGL